MKTRSLILFLVLFAIMLFFARASLNAFWVIVVFLVSFAYYVAVKHYLRVAIEEEKLLKCERK